MNKDKIKEIHENVKSELKKYNNSWIELGMNLVQLTKKIEAKDGKVSWKSQFKVSNFSEYCTVVLKENYEKMIKIRMAAKCLKNNRNELYGKYLNDKKVNIPGYSLIYVVESNEKKLNEWEKYIELIGCLFEDEYSRSRIEEQIRVYAKQNRVSSTSNKRAKTANDSGSYNFELIERRENIYLGIIPSLRDEIDSVFEGDDDERLVEIREDIDNLEEKIKEVVNDFKGVSEDE
ncbi:MAG: hypothetical protein ISR95_03515 [Candidatus Marinimicrobia bacterium]|nr:hypothetical protein [Candidatus Brocadiales bacterium]MBL7046683.1 hypothetical protein [Candidatus Neomarinimicrobiota bacterium]